MSWRRFLRPLSQRARRDAELAKDIQCYLDAETQENVARGMPPDEALEHARRKLGNTTLIREKVYHMNSPRFLETLWQDALYGLRQLRRSPSFTAVATITLALGIGAHTAIFSVVNSVLLRPLPYQDPDHLAWITERFALSFSSGAVLGPDYIAWRNHNEGFRQLEAFLSSQGPAISFSGAGDPIPVRMTNVTVGLFSMLGVRPVAGRLFTADEGNTGHENVLLISESLWQTQFGRSSAAIGKIVQLNNSAFTIVGVMPASVEFPQADVWTPIVLNSNLFQPQSRPMALVSVIGRLKAGVTPSQAESNLSLLAHRIDQDYPRRFLQSRYRRIELLPLHAVLVRDVRPLLLILLGTVSFVFLIACANVTNLSFSRAAVRCREFAIREALGAGRVRLVRQLLTESLLLAAMGSALGVLCGHWSVRLLKRLIPFTLPSDIGLDPRILVFAIAITILATIAFGLAPALVASRTEVSETLKSGGARAGTGRGAHHLRNVLVISEIALSLVLLIGAGLLAQSFLRLTNVHLGFSPDHVLTGQVWRPMTNGFQTPSQVPFFNEVLRRMRAIPGVEEAAATDRSPLSACVGGAVRARGATSDIQPLCNTTISQDYFRTMGVPLLKGRPFSDQDSRDAPPVVIMNEALAREAFGNRDPVGQQIGMYGLSGIYWCTVVGIVANTENSTLEQQPWPEIFVPYPQSLLPLSATFVLRTEGNPLAAAGLIRKAIQAVDRNQSVSNIQTLDEMIASSTAPQWFRMLLLSLFAVLALVLAAVGIFGVMAYSVSQRTHEIGVRLAVGARPGDILALAVRQGMFVAAIGLAIGIAVAVSLTRFLAGFLYDVQPTDVITFAGALLLLAGTALLACYIPARRAARVDPLVALRSE
ncbi:MAG: ABC transporter permease [Bryobacteraceae bacterium]